MILIVGPTAGGKSRLALELAQRLAGGGEIISADSMQVYRGMDIGTAKPTPAERRLVPHHLIDIVEPDEPWSVDEWLGAARRLVEEIRRRGKWPIIVGGTNLYVKAFLEGLFDGPPPDEALRAELAEWPVERLHGSTHPPPDAYRSTRAPYGLCLSCRCCGPRSSSASACPARDFSYPGLLAALSLLAVMPAGLVEGVLACGFLCQYGSLASSTASEAVPRPASAAPAMKMVNCLRVSMA